MSAKGPPSIGKIKLPKTPPPKKNNDGEQQYVPPSQTPADDGSNPTTVNNNVDRPEQGQEDAPSTSTTTVGRTGRSTAPKNLPPSRSGTPVAAAMAINTNESSAELSASSGGAPPVVPVASRTPSTGSSIKRRPRAATVTLPPPPSFGPQPTTTTTSTTQRPEPVASRRLSPPPPPASTSTPPPPREDEQKEDPDDEPQQQNGVGVWQGQQQVHSTPDTPRSPPPSLTTSFSALPAALQQQHQAQQAQQPPDSNPLGATLSPSALSQQGPSINTNNPPTSPSPTSSGARAPPSTPKWPIQQGQSPMTAPSPFNMSANQSLTAPPPSLSLPPQDATMSRSSTGGMLDSGMATPTGTSFASVPVVPPPSPAVPPMQQALYQQQQQQLLQQQFQQALLQQQQQQQQSMMATPDSMETQNGAQNVVQVEGVKVENNHPPTSLQNAPLKFVSIVAPGGDAPSVYKLSLRGDTDTVTVHALKSALAQYTGVSPGRQTLTKDGAFLDDQMVGANFNLQGGTVLYMDVDSQHPHHQADSNVSSRQPSTGSVAQKLQLSQSPPPSMNNRQMAVDPVSSVEVVSAQENPGVPVASPVRERQQQQQQQQGTPRSSRRHSVTAGSGDILDRYILPDEEVDAGAMGGAHEEPAERSNGRQHDPSDNDIVSAYNPDRFAALSRSAQLDAMFAVRGQLHELQKVLNDMESIHNRSATHPSRSSGYGSATEYTTRAERRRYDSENRGVSGGYSGGGGYNSSASAEPHHHHHRADPQSMSSGSPKQYYDEPRIGYSHNNSSATTTTTNNSYYERPSSVVRGGSAGSSTTNRQPQAYSSYTGSSRYDGMRSPFRVTK